MQTETKEKMMMHDEIVSCQSLSGFLAVIGGRPFTCLERVVS